MFPLCKPSNSVSTTSIKRCRSAGAIKQRIPSRPAEAETMGNSHLFSQNSDFSHIFDDSLLFNLSGPDKIIIAIRKPGGGRFGMNKNKQHRLTGRREFELLNACMPEGGPVCIHQGHGSGTASGRKGGGFLFLLHVVPPPPFGQGMNRSNHIKYTCKKTLIN